ncbi:D-glycero-alpha-D-manno-heptose-1,7-bisphosphate 7-phosphatase [Actinomycetota bacterium]
MNNKAVFLDRDGTIIKDNGYIGDLDDIEFYSFTLEALKLLQEEFLLFIVTNQSGIGKGLVRKKDVENLNDHILRYLSENGITIKELFYCPHKTEDRCKCKKPLPYFIDFAAEKYNIDKGKSYVIGDHPSDILFAKNAGATGIFVLTGHGRGHLKEIDEDTITSKNLYYAAKKILKEDKKYTHQ